MLELKAWLSIQAENVIFQRNFSLRPKKEKRQRNEAKGWFLRTTLKLREDFYVPKEESEVRGEVNFTSGEVVFFGSLSFIVISLTNKDTISKQHWFMVWEIFLSTRNATQKKPRNLMSLNYDDKLRAAYSSLQIMSRVSKLTRNVSSKAQQGICMRRGQNGNILAWTSQNQCGTCEYPLMQFAL